MRILAVDTATWWGGLALAETRDNGLDEIARLELRETGSHAAFLLRRVDRLLAEAGWAKEDIELFAATRGPGSFTGLRVALGTLRGLALATGRPAVGVGTLAALVEAHGPAEAERWGVLGAGRGEVYVARFDAAGTPPREIQPPRLCAGSEIGALVTGPAVLVPGFETAIPVGTPAAVRRARFPGGLAAAVARIAASVPEASRAESLPLEPLYVRPPDARPPRPPR